MRCRRFTDADSEDYITGGTEESSMDLPMTPSSSTGVATFIFILLSTMPVCAQQRSPVIISPAADAAAAKQVAGHNAHVRGPNTRVSLHRRRLPATGGFVWIPSPASVEMESSPIEDVQPRVHTRDLVIPARRFVQCHRPHVIEIGTGPRRKPLPRVVYGSPMHCAPIRIVWADPAR
jgi:hypothetical protein